MAEETIEPFDASDPAAIDNASRDVARWARDDADVIRAILHTKKGRAFILRQLDRCHINSPDKFVPGMPDATAHNLGLERYGILLLADVMSASVDLYMTAVKEQQEEMRRQTEVQRSARKRREETERGPTAADQVAHLPAPKGFDGHTPPPVLSKRKR